jgi:hypothetical protein
MGLGDTLHEARVRMGMSTSEVAAATRMKVQMVDAIEQEDFSDVAAPIYGKGFIKLFAEHVGLDAAPLVQEYVDVHVHHKPRTLGEETREVLMTSETQAEPEPADSFPEPDEPAPLLHQPEVPADDLFAQAAPQAEPPPAEPEPANAPTLFHPDDEPRPGDAPPPARRNRGSPPTRSPSCAARAAAREEAREADARGRLATAHQSEDVPKQSQVRQRASSSPLKWYIVNDYALIFQGLSFRMITT